MCRYKRTIPQLIDDGTIRGNTPIRHIPYIGPYFGSRLNRLGFATVNHLMNYLNRKSAQQVYDFLTRVTQNRRRNQCMVNNYIVQDFNFCAYHSLRLLMIELQNRRNDWRDLRLSRKPRLQIPIQVDRGTEASKFCTCSDQDECNGNRLCRWTNNACLPRFRPGFQGIDRLPAQYHQGPNQNGLAYNQGWRVPGTFPLRQLPRRRVGERRGPQQGNREGIASRTRHQLQQQRRREGGIATRTRQQERRRGGTRQRIRGGGIWRVSNGRLVDLRKRD